MVFISNQDNYSETEQNKHNGAIIIPTPCGYEIAYPSKLTTIKERRSIFITFSSESQLCYLVVTHKTKAVFKLGGSSDHMLRLYESLPWNEYEIMDENGLFYYKEVPVDLDIDTYLLHSDISSDLKVNIIMLDEDNSSVDNIDALDYTTYCLPVLIFKNCDGFDRALMYEREQTISNDILIDEAKDIAMVHLAKNPDLGALGGIFIARNINQYQMFCEHYIKSQD